MEDTMVSARVPRAKKEAVGALLSSMGTTASELINCAYDYVLAEKALPRADAANERPRTRDDFTRFVERTTLAIDWRGGTVDGDYKSVERQRRLADYESLA